MPQKWRRFDGLAAGFGGRDTRPPASLITVQQVHGSDVIDCDALEPGEQRQIRGDALVATRAGVVVGVKTADCVPILLFAPAAGARDHWAASVHAGWRGAAAGVIAAAIDDAKTRGHDPAAVRAAIGPCIGACCYEVGEEVATVFSLLGLPVIEGGPKPCLDLAEIARALLLRAGVTAANVTKCAPCTRCNMERYHSYRGSPTHAGRQMSWIGWQP